MRRQNITFSKLPDGPGVYFFLGPRKKVLYIGKATSLRDRVRSYFTGDIEEARSAAIKKMLEEARRVEYQTTDSVLEALLLEVQLIKSHKPKYNVREKDDKSFNYVVITNELYPRVLKVRAQELYQTFPDGEIKYLFGPFPHSGQLNEALRLMRKIFPFFDTKKPVDQLSERDKKRLLLNQQIGLYPHSLSKKEHDKTIRNLKLFFEGKKKELILKLEKEMNIHVRKHEFEKAEELKRTIFALKYIQDVSLLKEDMRKMSSQFRIEAYDIAHTAGRGTVGVMVVFLAGDLDRGGYRQFKISKEQNNDISSLKEVLRRRLFHDEWLLPKLIVVDGGKIQKRAAEQVLSEFSFQIPVAAVVKDERHRPKDILGPKKIITEHDRDILTANAEAHRFALQYHRKSRRPA